VEARQTIKPGRKEGGLRGEEENIFDERVPL
jgi:hypothetical protein